MKLIVCFSNFFLCFFDLHVLTPPQEPDALDSLKMEVGIEDCLHIEFEYDKSAYHLQDVVIGKVRVCLGSGTSKGFHRPWMHEFPHVPAIAARIYL